MSQNELLDQFVLEARDCIERIGQRLLEVERKPEDAELLNDLFRTVHTLKGNCGLFEFAPLETVVHAAEDVLDQVRHRKLAYTNAIADTMLDSLDLITELIDEIEADGAISGEHQSRADKLAHSLRECLKGGKDAAAPAHAAAPAKVAPPPWLLDFANSQPALDAALQVVRYRPEPECFFKGEDPMRLASATPGLVHLQLDDSQRWPGPEAFDCYECRLSFLIASSAPAAYLEEHFRYVPEQVEILPLSIAKTASAIATANPADASAATSAPVAAADEAARRLVALRARELWADQVRVLQEDAVSPGARIAVRRTLRQLIEGVGGEADEKANAQIASIERTADLVQWIHDHSPVREAPADEAAAAADAEHEQEAEVEAGSPAGANVRRERSESSSGGDKGQKVLKIAQEKIDQLMDLIGEMVVAKNGLPYLAQRAETVFGQRELAREIKAQYSVINRISEDMQNAIMQVRMMPVGVIFQRFPRLVRDISRRLGKEVELVIEGEETEADKNVIEALADPLIHILRNSLDHGLETAQVRLAAGKPATGVLKVSARQESDQVILEISDDGAGIDPQRVRAKAIERGLVTADGAGSLSDHEAVQLVFLPGFSTAEQVSDLSGRGVGMDVVRTAVERVGGTVTLASERGRGTTLTLSLPLSMAVTNVMIVESHGARFGVPMSLIVETVRVHRDDIHRFKNSMTVVLRGKIVPLRPLNELLGEDAQPLENEAGELAVLVCRLPQGNVGFIVDEFRSATDIILKPLDGVLGGLTHFAGTALMGDGSVLLILNPKDLVS